jgi:hypothetical protein
MTSTYPKKEGNKLGDALMEQRVDFFLPVIGIEEGKVAQDPQGAAQEGPADAVAERTIGMEANTMAQKR